MMTGSVVARRRLTFAIALFLLGCASTSPRDKAADYMALYYAANGGNEVLAAALLERGAPVDAPHPDSAGELSYQAAHFNSPLQAAAKGGYVEIVVLLLRHKPVVDYRCCDGPAALGMAAQNGHVEIVKMRLAAGADSTIVSDYGPSVRSATPLEAARAAGHTEVVRVVEESMKAKR